MPLFDNRRTERLGDIIWKETSAVDRPANEEPGWAVIKAEDFDLDALSELLGEGGRAGAVAAAVADNLEVLDFKGASADVLSARDHLIEYAKGVAKSAPRPGSGVPGIRGMALLKALGAILSAGGDEAEEEDWSGVMDALPVFFQSVQKAISAPAEYRDPLLRDALAGFEASVADHQSGG